MHVMANTHTGGEGLEIVDVYLIRWIGLSHQLTQDSIRRKIS